MQGKNSYFIHAISYAHIGADQLLRIEVFFYLAPDSRHKYSKSVGIVSARSPYFGNNKIVRERLSDVLSKNAKDFIFVIGQMYFFAVEIYAVRYIIDF